MKTTGFYCPDCEDSTPRRREYLTYDDQRDQFVCPHCEREYSHVELMELYNGAADNLESDLDWIITNMIGGLEKFYRAGSAS